MPAVPCCPSPTSYNADGPQGLLAVLPESLLERVLSLLASQPGGSVIRSTCRWLRDAFDACNTATVLRGPCGKRRQLQQLPASFRVRLLDLVCRSPRICSLTMHQDASWVAWEEVMAAGGQQLCSRLQVRSSLEGSVLGKGEDQTWGSYF